MPGILVFIPMYRCEKQIGRVLRSLEPLQGLFAEILIVDNCSTDGSVAAAMAAMKSLIETTVTLVQNDQNYHFGGSHKIAFDYARQAGHAYLLILHGDDQADIRDAVPLIAAGEHTKHDLTLGARFHPASKRVGYSRFRTYGNHAVNLMASLVTGRRIYDTGAGLNIYGRKVFADTAYLAMPDDLTFSTCLLFDCIRKKCSFSFFPLTWREEDQVSNARVIRQGVILVIMMLRYFLRLKRFLPPPPPQRQYSYKMVVQSAPRAGEIRA